MTHPPDSPRPQDQSPVLVENYFRREYGRLVSVLAGKFGTAQLEVIEDAVQAALMSALTSWSRKGVPENPGGWLHRVAHNNIIDQFRRSGVAEAHARDTWRPSSHEPGEGHLTGEILDEELRMLFVCCDENLPTRTRLVLALKILCGFSTKEIAFRLLSNEEAVGKRIRRGREQLRKLAPDLDSPSEEKLRARLPAVHQVLYLLFTEGYSSTRSEEPIRRELCDEAIRLAQLLVTHPSIEHPESWALLAVMHFHHARFEGRIDAAGGLLLLEEQDRSRWDREQIEAGFVCMGRSASGEVFSRYHAEAGVLAEHCIAASYADTRWPKIVELYEILENLSPSPLHTLNRAIAVAEWKGPEQGLAILKTLTPPSWLQGYYLWDATLGELHRRAGHRELGGKHLQRALDAAPTDWERALLRRRLDHSTRAR